MKNVWLSLFAMAALSAPIFAINFEEKTHNSAFYFGQGLRSATNAADAAQNATSPEIAVYTMPISMAHGVHGYLQRFTESNKKTYLGFAEDFRFGRQPNPDFTAYPNFWKRIKHEGFKNFNILHPIQSLKGNTSMRMPPVIGSVIVTPTVAGFLHHLLTNNDTK